MQNDYQTTISSFQSVTMNRLRWLLGPGESLQLSQDVFPTQCTYERWLCLIQLAHQEFRFTLKCHFGESFCAFTKTQPVTDDSVNLAFDRIRELCNLSMGGIKQSFGDTAVGVSLPLITGGFDEIYLRPPLEKLSFFSVWAIDHIHFRILFSLEAIVFNDSILKTMNPLLVSSSAQNTNDVELF